MNKLKINSFKNCTQWIKFSLLKFSVAANKKTGVFSPLGVRRVIDLTRQR